MAKKAKKQSVKKNAKAASAEKGQLYEEIIQDRVAGMRTTEIATKYNMNRNTVSTILAKHEDRITAERTAYLAERQEKINKALDDDVERLAGFLNLSGELMDEGLTRLLEKIRKGELTDKTMITAVNTAVAAFDRVRTIILNQQKEAGK